MCIRFLTTEIDGFTHSFVDGGVGYNNSTLLTTLLLKEHPFDYKVATDKLIMVSLGTGGVFYKNYVDSHLHRFGLLGQAATECRTTAHYVYRFYKNERNVKYFRFDPDIIGRYGMDDATAFKDIQDEMVDWCAHQEPKLSEVAKALTAAATLT
jgi:hypothetical protein